MLVETFSILVHAQAETVWKLLLDRVDNPHNYLHGVKDVRVIERSPAGVLREIVWEGDVVREKIFIDEANYVITSQIQEHPVYTGKVVNQILKTSVQNPMAPVGLETHVELERKSLHLQGLVRTEAETIADIDKELTVIKLRAEEMEREENRSKTAEGYGVNT